VNVAPAMQASIFGSRSAYNMYSNEYIILNSIGCSNFSPKGKFKKDYTLRVIAAPVECP